jgi:hypothetical protein
MILWYPQTAGLADYFTIQRAEGAWGHNGMEFQTPPMPSSATSPRPRRGRNAALSLLALTTCAACAAPILQAQTLLGSHESLLRQNEEAREHDFSYLRTSADVRDYVQQGLLVRLPGNSDYELAGDEVSFPYARPEVKTFIERLADQYHGACGEPLVVTSLTRPITRQPPNASAISVHPTGMAVDLRRSDSSGCRQWLETVLLDLENKGVIEATREQYPPHYHVAVFPNPYLQYVASGEALPDIQVARSTHETTSRARVSRVRVARVSRASRARLARVTGRRGAHARATVAVSHHRSGSAKRSRVVHTANGRRVAPRHRVVVARSKSNGVRHSKGQTARTR